MAVTLVLKSAASDLTGGADFTRVLSQGTETSSTVSTSTASNATEDDYGFSAAGVPNSASWPAGNITVELEVTTAHANIQLSCCVSRVNSAGVVQESGAFTAEQSAGTTGVKTFTCAPPAGGWTAGSASDRLRVTYRRRNTASGARTVAFRTGTTDCEVATQFVDARTGTASTWMRSSPTAVGAKTATEPAVTAVRSEARSGSPGGTTTSSLGDAFTGTSPSATWSTYSIGSLASVSQNNRIEVTLPTTPTHGKGYVTAAAYDFDSVYAKYDLTGAPSSYAFSAVIEVAVGAAYIALIYESNGQMYLRYDTGTGVPSDGNATISAQQLLWMRLRRSGGNILWETAPDASGVPGTWTTHRTVAESAFTPGFSGMNVRLYGYVWDNNPGGTLYIDDLNGGVASGGSGGVKSSSGSATVSLSVSTTVGGAKAGSTPARTDQYSHATAAGGPVSVAPAGSTVLGVSTSATTTGSKGGAGAAKAGAAEAGAALGSKATAGTAATRHHASAPAVGAKAGAAAALTSARAVGFVAGTKSGAGAASTAVGVGAVGPTGTKAAAGAVMTQCTAVPASLGSKSASGAVALALRPAAYAVGFRSASGATTLAVGGSTAATGAKAGASPATSTQHHSTTTAGASTTVDDRGGVAFSAVVTWGVVAGVKQGSGSAELTLAGDSVTAGEKAAAGGTSIAAESSLSSTGDKQGSGHASSSGSSSARSSGTKLASGDIIILTRAALLAGGVKSAHGQVLTLQASSTGTTGSSAGSQPARVIVLIPSATERTPSPGLSERAPTVGCAERPQAGSVTSQDAGASLAEVTATAALSQR